MCFFSQRVYFIKLLTTKPDDEHELTMVLHFWSKTTIARLNLQISFQPLDSWKNSTMANVFYLPNFWVSETLPKQDKNEIVWGPTKCK